MRKSSVSYIQIFSLDTHTFLKTFEIIHIMQRILGFALCFIRKAARDSFCSCDRTKKGSFTEFLIYLSFICTLLGFHENFCFLFSRTFIFVLRENCLWKLMKIFIVIAIVCANMFTKTEIFYKFCRTTWLFLFYQLNFRGNGNFRWNVQIWEQSWKIFLFSQKFLFF